MRVKVLLPVSLDGLFDYEVEGAVDAGQLIRVPFGSLRLTGCVWQTERDSGYHSKYRGTLRVGDVLPLSLNQDVRAFIDWSAAWTCSPRGGFLRLALGGVKDIMPYKPLSRLVVAQSTDTAPPQPHNR